MSPPSIALNDSQKEAVRFAGQRLLVKAGPGTGKTRTLTSRIGYLVGEKKVDPASILALTFTNRAADEMGTRLTELLGPGTAKPIFIGTFHGLGFEILRREWSSIGFTRPPFIYDEEDKRILISHLLRDSGERALHTTVKSVLAMIDQDRLRQPDPDREGQDSLDPIGRLYNRTKQAENAVDFGDLIALPLDLFGRDPARLAAFRTRWRHIFIDEYQDVNAAQVALIKLLAEGAESFMAIGDPDQAIYSFRGSDAAHFNRFGEDFPGSTVLHLRDNYRSSVTIIEASDQIIGSREGSTRPAPRVRSHEQRGLRLRIQSLPTDRAETRFVVRTIESLVGGLGRYGLEDRSTSWQEKGDTREQEEVFGFSDIAVLYRLNAQAPPLCAALDEAGIPFQRVGTGTKGADPLERGILALARLADRTDKADQSCASCRTLESLGIDVDRAVSSVRRGLANGAGDRSARTVPLLRAVAGYLATILPAKNAEFRSRLGPLEQKALEIAASGLDFLDVAALKNSEDPWAARSEKITLSTIHAAKGLEFPVVFITGLEEGLIPYVREDEAESVAALEEERRLFYVGMTRAKSRLHLTSARRRFLFGQTVEAAPSPYVHEISDDLVRFVRAKPGARKKKSSQGGESQMGLFS